MTFGAGVAAVCLVGAAVVTAWPVGAGRARRGLIIGGQQSPEWALSRMGPTIRGYVLDSPKRSRLLFAALAAGLGAVLGGPVAAFVSGVYGGLAAHTVLRQHSARAAANDRIGRLDGLSALAADLRAGLPASVLLGRSWPGAAVESSDRITLLAQAAGRLAEQTGAPLADLLERIEADARALDRALASAAAQAAGARATAWLLAGLPLGGIALGYGIGVDPLHVLLHTPIGAGCAVAAVVLQIVGLAWADRLSGSGARAA